MRSFNGFSDIYLLFLGLKIAFKSHFNSIMGQRKLFFINQYKPNMENKLFEEFGPVTKEQWIQQAIADLKGKDFTTHLVSKTAGGLEIMPFYTEEDLETLAFLEAYHNKIHPPSEIPGLSPRIWSNVFHVGIEDQNKGNALILDALQNGCDALVLEVSGKEDFNQLLKGVELPYIQIFLVLSSGSPSVVLAPFLDWFGRKDWGSDQLQGGVLWDGMTRLFHEESEMEVISQELAMLIDKLEPFPAFKACCIDFSCYHEAGATAIQELKFGFASIVELLDHLGKAGVPAQKVFEKAMLRFSVGSDYFEEISKIRAGRIFFQSLGELYQVEVLPENIQVFCQTSNWTKSRMDVYTNMLRNTTEAMSAILGGCNVLWVRPHDEVLSGPDSFSRRMARNISNILREESYLDKVLDPVAGSYFIENLTGILLDRTKESLENVEASGGWWKLYKDQLIQEEVKSTRKKRQSDILELQKSKIGANKYQLKEEKAKFTLSEKVEELPWQLFAGRETDLLESKNETVA
ncbi:heterodimeric methylmalonyl-CoA mutase small subunit [Cecembia calidifontis]|uniref:Heterodimeric methylmalonyl-CoA mutase small subunit n=2 Tax=Cecembia calidifontis TaxID=1187080 RepID=A0A4Q7P3U2_9BACT|nr:heterodimeric methylmalonyl-CoA mutase small subunit [Cecembia calidifontis]